MTSVTSKITQSLSELEADELLEEQSVLDLTEVLNATTSGTALTLTDIVTHLTNQKFYLPRVTAYNGQIGLFVSDTFRPFSSRVENCTAVAAAKEGDPIRFELLLESGDKSVTVVASCQPGTKPRGMMDAFYGLYAETKEKDADGNYILETTFNSKSVDAIIKALIPSAVSVIPDGDYDVKTFTLGEKSCRLELTDGKLVTVNKSCPPDVKTIRSFQGCIYHMVNGVFARGISITGGSKKFYSSEDTTFEIGEKFTIHGVTTNNAGTGDYSIAKLSRDGNPASSVWYGVEDSLAVLGCRRFGKGITPQVEIKDIKPKTGKMTAAKPVFTTVK